MTNIPAGKKPSAFTPKTEVAETDELILVGEYRFSVKRLKDIIAAQATAEATSAALRAVEEGIPDAVGFNFRDAWDATAIYSKNDHVHYTLADGRTASYVAKTTTQALPTETADWQPVGIPAAGDAGGGYTLVKLSAVTTATYDIDLAREDRFLIVRDAAKTLATINKPSLGNAIVAFKAPVTGTIHPIAWAAGSTPTWEGDPPATESAGRGDVVLLRTWDGATVTGRVSQRNVLFENVPVTAVTGTLAMWHFKNGSLANVLAPGTNDFVFNSSTARTNLGFNIASGNYLYTNALSGMNWAAGWTVGFVVSNLPASQPSSGFGTLFAVASTVDTADYTTLRYHNANIQAFAREATPTFNAPVAAGGATEAASVNFKHSGLAEALHLMLLEYDGAGQFQVRDVKTNRVYTLGDGVAEPTTRYPGNVSTNVIAYADSRVSVGTTWRANATSLSPHLGATISLHGGFVATKVFTAAERAEQYNILRNTIAAADPAGPQLPAL